MKTIQISKDFSRTPGGRFRDHGRFSGEDFRERLLLPQFLAAIRDQEKLTIDFDGVAGLPSSFLEEAFGGLVRECSDLPLTTIFATLVLHTSEPGLEPYVELASQYMREAAGKRAKVRV